VKRRPILRAINFGGDVAENDDGLHSYFVETSTFYDVVGDTADVILGPKGSGKTAIFRHLMNPDVAIEGMEDVDVVPALNPNEALIFRQLQPLEGANFEYILRLAWLSYSLALVGNHIVREYSEAVDTSSVRAILDQSGLLATKEDSRRSLWEKIGDTLQRANRLETTVTFSPDTGMPLVGATLDFDAELDQEKDKKPLEFQDLLSAEIMILERLGRRCWIIFDRLDEAFHDRREFEVAALRGLLRAHLDICSYGKTVRPKLFLRTDLLRRVTAQAGFVNATHMRVQNISWDEPSLIDR
jgi:hypothetical protein